MRDETILDLYSGMGGLGTGFSHHFTVLDAVDYWKDACDTYRANHQITKVRNESVIDFISDCIPKDYSGMLYSGVIGGVPCQEFSVLNQKKDLNSPRANQLYIFLDAIKNLRPEFALIENVASIPKHLKQFAIKELRKANYKVVSKVVLAKNFGSVQKRRRWILTASKSKFIFPSIIPATQMKTAKDILLSGDENTEFKMSDRIKAGIQKLPSGKWVALPGKKWKEYFIADYDKPLPAIVNVLKNRIVHPNRQRYLSFKEVLAAQGFSTDYKMMGSKTSKCQQLANAVPVELAQAFARAFANRISGNIGAMDNYIKEDDKNVQ